MNKHTGPERPQKISGFGHVFAAATYSWGGLRRLWGEQAFRHEVIGYGAIVILFLLVGADRTAHAIAFILFAVTISAEALNTAIEEVVDRISPERSDMARNAKDLGSFAVFCLLIANGAWAAHVIVSALFSA